VTFRKRTVGQKLLDEAEVHKTNDVIEYQLTGEYECKLDAKGRLRLPTSLIRQIGFSGILELAINRGFEKHLMLYPKTVWEGKTKIFNQLNIYDTKERQALRYFYRGASMLHMDSADRILLPSGLVEYAGLKKELILFAYHQQIEVWDKTKYLNMLNDEPESFAEVADGIFGSQKSSGGEQAQTDVPDE